MSLTDIFISVAICGAAMLLLCIRVLFVKNGRFSHKHACGFNQHKRSIKANEPNTHKSRLTEHKDKL